MSARKLAKFRARAARGLAWLKVFGPDYGFDVALVPADYRLDLGGVDEDVLSWAYTGHTVNSRDKFDQACDRLESSFGSAGAFDGFLFANGFTIEEDSWLARAALWLTGTARRKDDKDWALLTQAWIEVLIEDRVWSTLKSARGESSDER